MSFRNQSGDRIDHLLGAACPKCGSKVAHRSHRKSVLDFFLSWAGIWPYRCQRCRSAYRAIRALRKLGEERPWHIPAGAWRVPERE
ncbi:MAG: hypothetical protein KJZ84_01750 [Bryobacteraceae bacterium]|nr:hypothetical protein [Bryobacteraceae bacterium]